MAYIFKSRLVTSDKRVYEVAVWESENYSNTTTVIINWIQHESWFRNNEQIYYKMFYSATESVNHAEALVACFPNNPIFSHAVNT